MDQKIKIVLIIFALVVLLCIIIGCNSVSTNNNGNREEYEQTSNYLYDQKYIDPKIHPYSRAISYRPDAQPPIIQIPISSVTNAQTNAPLCKISDNVPKCQVQTNPSGIISATVKLADSTTNMDRTVDKIKIPAQLRQNVDFSDIDDTDPMADPDTNLDIVRDHVVDQKLGLNVKPNTDNALNPDRAISLNTAHQTSKYDPKLSIFDQKIKTNNTTYSDTQIDGDLVYETNNIVGYCTVPGEHFGIYSSSGEDMRIIPMNDPRFGPHLDQIDAGVIVQDDFPIGKLNKVGSRKNDGLNVDGSYVDSISEKDMTMNDDDFYKMIMDRPKMQVMMEDTTDCVYDESEKKRVCAITDINKVADKFRLNTFDTYRGLYRNSSSAYSIRNGAKMYDTID
jgi:hypothetical protein